MMILLLLGSGVAVLAVGSWYLHNQSKAGVGNLLAVLAACCLTGFIQNALHPAPQGQFANALPWVVLAAGLGALTLGIVILMSNHRLLTGLRRLGVVQVWPNRGDGFNFNGQDYLESCRSMIRRTKPGNTIRLMSTAGDGIAIISPELDNAFRSPLKHGCRYQVILGNPVSERIEKKQDAEDRSGRYGAARQRGSVRQKIRDKIRHLDNWCLTATTDPAIRALPESLRVRCVEDFPTANIVDNGDEALIALQVIDRKGVDSPVFHVTKNGALYKFLQEHFDFLFEKMSKLANEAAKQFDLEVAPALGPISEKDRKA